MSKKLNNHPRTWHLKHPELLQQVEGDLRLAYPQLHVFIEEQRVFVRGSFPLLVENRILDRYVIEIEFLNDYPNSLPVVREVGGRIARISDRHVDRSKGDICLFVPEERWRIWPRGASFRDFLDVPVRNYFLGETLVELGYPRPFGERSHGGAGILEFYVEELGIQQADIIVRFVECLSRGSVRGHHFCPCGSGKRVRNCHLEKLRDLLDKIPPEVAAKSLKYLR